MADGYVAPRTERDFDLHILDKEIDHPSVFLSWCVSPQFYAQRLRQKHKHPLVLLMQLEKRLPDGTTFLARYVFKDCLEKLGGLVTFPRPGGKWTVSALLVEITKEEYTSSISTYERLRTSFLERDGPGQYNWSLLQFSEYDRSDMAKGRVDDRITSKTNYNAHASKFCSIDVTIPDGIYAKPLPAFVEKWVLAYAGEKNIRLYDECDIRRRLLFYSAHLQFPHYAVWESLKRLNALRSALALFLAGKNGTEVFRRAFAPQLVFAHPSVEARHAWHEPSVYWKVPFLKRMKDALESAVAKHKQDAMQRKLGQQIRKREESDAEMDAQQAEKERIERLAQAIQDGTASELPLAVCGQDDMSLRAKKIARKSIVLRLDLTKREVCRPYG